MSLLKVSNLTLEYPRHDGFFQALKSVSLEIAPGEILGLVGESGAGKSSVGSAIIGLIEQPGRITAGTMEFQSKTYQMADQESLADLRGKNISMIFQDPLTSLNPLFTIEQHLVETIRRHRSLSFLAAREEAVRLLEEVGVHDVQTRIMQYPHQFSGGMRQRVVIALALCSKPSLIIADEPTTALDVSVQSKVLELIRELAKTHQVGVVLVTHDMGVISQVTDRVAVMYRGEVVETGTTHQILKASRHDYTQSLVSVVPPAHVKLDRFPEVNYIERVQKHSALEDVSSHWLGSALKKEARLQDNLILSIKNVSIDFVVKRSIFPGRRRRFMAVKSFNLDLKQGEVVGLVGESGSGKSTIARMVAGIYAPFEGQVFYKGELLHPLRSKLARRGSRQEIQMIFQDPYSSINPRMRVVDIVSEPISHYKLAEGAEVKRIALDLLDMVGVGAVAGQKFPHEFSGGQRQRICIARALAARPRLLICDEPTSALDVSIQAQILNLLKDLQANLKLTLLFISHDLPVVRQMSDRIVVLRHGQMCEEADTVSLFECPQHPYTRELLDLMPRIA